MSFIPSVVNGREQWSHGQLRKTTAAPGRRPGNIEIHDRGKDTSASLALRARTVLLAADGVLNIRIVDASGFSGPTVRRWSTLYEESGVEGWARRPAQASHG